MLTLAKLVIVYYPVFVSTAKFTGTAKAHYGSITTKKPLDCSKPVSFLLSLACLNIKFTPTLNLFLCRN